MATACPVYGQRPPRKARVCDACGEPIVRVVGTERTLRALAPSAGLQQGVPASADSAHTAGQLPDVTTQPRWVRLLIVAAVVIVGLALSATYVALRSTPQKGPDGTSYGVVQMSADPGLRWQHPLAQVAPDLRCPTATPQGYPSPGACYVTASATVQDVVVVSVQRSQQSELVGLDRSDGAVKWRRRGPAGSTYACMVTDARLWCLSVPLIYHAITNDSPIGGTDPPFSSGPRVSAAYRSAALTRLEPTTGAVLHSSPVPGSTAGAAFAGIGFGGFYVVGRGSQSASTVVWFSMNGTPQWNHLVTVIQQRSGLSVVNSKVATPQVYELGGRSLVSLSEVAGRQAVFAVDGGTPVRSGLGHLVTVTGTTIVTQVGSTALSVGDRKIPENAVAVLSADDRSSGEPVLVTRYSAPAPDSTNESAAATFLTRAPTDPLRTGHRLQKGDERVAHCGRVIVTAMSNVFAGYDSTSGRRLWVAVSSGGINLQVRCAGGEVVLANEYRATAFSLKTGAQAWSVSYSVGSILTGSGYGDPQDGLVAGPSLNAGLPSASTSVSYLR